MQLGVSMTIKNRKDTKVYLHTTNGFEGASLPAYSNLGKTINIPSKGILKENYSVLSESDSHTENTSGEINMPLLYFLKMPFGSVEGNAEFETFNPEQAIRSLGSVSGIAPDYGRGAESAIFVNNTGAENNFTIEYQLRLNVASSAFTPNPSGWRIFNAQLFTSVFNEQNELVTHLSNETISTNNPINVVNFKLSDVLLGEGYKVGIYLTVVNALQFIIVDTGTGLSHNEYNNIGFTVSVTSGRLKMTYLSKTQPTQAKVFMIHESLSRIAETITNNALTVRSDYYGRKDSNVNPVAVGGAGSLRCITNGYFLRRAKLTSGEPYMYVSFKDIFDGLNAIDAIGYGVEGNLLRIEPWEYFYTEDVLFRCSGINEIKRTLDVKRCFALFNTGYNKWESDTWSSIDGFHGKRQYRTRIKNVDTKLERYCKFIADSYAIEATRRSGIEDLENIKARDETKDWKYDNDTFIIDLIRDANNGIMVNSGIGGDYNSDNGTLIDPASVFNVELSPARMAARWYSWLMQAFRVKSLVVSGRYGILPEQCVQCGDCYRSYPNAFINGGASALFVGGVTEITPSDVNLEQEIREGVRLCPAAAIVITEEGVVVAEGIGELIFTGAEGYVEAITKSKKTGSVTVNDVLERQDWDTYKISGNPVPKFKPELVEFEYPLTVAEFMAIRSNPHGLIEFDGEYGWIREIEADLLKGVAKFTLMVKRE
jgi:ferredoxin